MNCLDGKEVVIKCVQFSVEIRIRGGVTLVARPSEILMEFLLLIGKLCEDRLDDGIWE